MVGTVPNVAFVRAQWFEIDSIVELVFAFCDPRTIFAAAVVSSLWRETAHELGDAVWADIVSTLVPRTSLGLKLMVAATGGSWARFAALRRFGPDDLRESASTIPSLMLIANGAPLVWLKKVPQAMSLDDVLRVVFPRRAVRLELGDVFVANGIALNAVKPIAEHVWPTRPIGGAGWGYDLAILCSADLPSDLPATHEPVEFTWQ